MLGYVQSELRAAVVLGKRFTRTYPVMLCYYMSFTIIV